MLRIAIAAVVLQSVFAAAAGATDWTQRERAATQAEKAVLSPWTKAWKAKDAKAFAALAAPTAEVSSWAAPRVLSRDTGGVKEFRWETAAPKPLASEALIKETAAYLAGFTAVEDVAFTVVDARPAASGAGTRLSVAFDLRGRAKDGALRTDRGLLAVDLSETGKITRIEPSSMETLTAAEPAFKEITREAGFASVPVVARQEALRRGGYALAIGDYDGDGKPDVYVGGSAAGKLFHNEGGGKFTDVTRESGLGEVTMVKAALFADMDNTGRTGLVLQRFVLDAEQELAFYRNVGGGKFVKADAVVTRKKKHDRPMSMTAADFNFDGLLDLYVGYPGTRDFTDSGLDTEPGVAHQAIYLNKGGWRFEEQADARKPEIYSEVVRPHSALGMSVDGRPGLVVIDDRGDASRFYQNLGDGRFADVHQKSGLINKGWGMMAVAGDFDREGREGVYFSNIDFTAGHRAVKFVDEQGPDAAKALPGYERAKTIFSGNRLYKAGETEGTFAEVTAKSGTGWAGEAPAGAVWFDYNNDGMADLYVPNGLWSADPNRDVTSDFVASVLKGEAQDKPEVVNAVMKSIQESGASFAGYQRNRLFRNNGDGTFTEVGYVTGADRLEDGYVAAVADLTGDGTLDLVLRNADPPSLAWSYAPVTVLKNRGLGRNKLLSVHLKGSDGGSSAFGARVTIEVAGRRQTQEIRSVKGCVQDEQAAFFGVGEAKSVDTLEVLWPSGVKDRFKDVKPGAITVREGQNRLSSK